MKHGIARHFFVGLGSTCGSTPPSQAPKNFRRVYSFRLAFGSGLKVKMAFTRQTSVVFRETQCKLRFPAKRYRVPGFKSGTTIGFKPGKGFDPSKMDRSKLGWASRNVRESGMYMKAPGFEPPSRLHSLRIKFTEYLRASEGWEKHQEISRFLCSLRLPEQ